MYARYGLMYAWLQLTSLFKLMLVKATILNPGLFCIISAYLHLNSMCEIFIQTYVQSEKDNFMVTNMFLDMICRSKNEICNHCFSATQKKKNEYIHQSIKEPFCR